uniref:Nudix hydrolase domain-containing protein n=1 Tax=Haemonchus contortus TaxID=6289 RepID=A0A7I4Z4C9_HAECO
MHTKDLPRELVEESRFATEIVDTINAWKEQKLNGAWVHISLEDSHVVPRLAKLGFKFFHSATNEMTMTCWLGDESSRMPTASFSYYSVSALVIDEKGSVLMVREQREHCGVSYWKFPGGVPKPSEHLLRTAERKVKEETGIVAKGGAVIGLSQRLYTEYKDSCGFFFYCLMKYVKDAQVGRVETVSDEITDVRWFTRDEINSMPRKEIFHHHLDIWQAYLNLWRTSGERNCMKSPEETSLQRCSTSASAEKPVLAPFTRT